MSLYAFRRLADGRLRERFGLDFEDFAPGQRFRHRPGVTFSQQDNVEESLDTVNGAMVHYDARYAGQTAWKRELMVSTLTLQRLIGMSSKTFGRKARLTGFSEIAMTAPVFGGDTIYTESQIVGLSDTANPDTGQVDVICHGFNQDGREIARVTYSVAVYRRGRHPEEAGGAGGEPATEARYHAYRTEADGALTEQVGLFFEDCEPGETFIHWPRRSMQKEEAMRHAWRSLELAPQYHDLEWAGQHAGGVVRFGEAWVIGAVTAMTTRTFGRVVANLGWTDIVLGAEVHDDDTLEAQSSIIEKRESKSRPNEGILTVDTLGRNQKGETVVSYRRRLLVYRRDGVTPYAAAGY
ncbi:MAG: MaoC family dehydratase [Burkholderiales bacterium]